MSINPNEVWEPTSDHRTPAGTLHSEAARDHLGRGRVDDVGRRVGLGVDVLATDEVAELARLRGHGQMLDRRLRIGEAYGR